jgi:hypothetical protein
MTTITTKDVLAVAVGKIEATTPVATETWCSACSIGSSNEFMTDTTKPFWFMIFSSIFVAMFCCGEAIDYYPV